MQQRSGSKWRRPFTLLLAFGAAGVVAIAVSFMTGSSAPVAHRPATAAASGVAPVVVSGPPVTNAPVATLAPTAAPAAPSSRKGRHHVLGDLGNWIAGLFAGFQGSPPLDTPAVAPSAAPTEVPAPTPAPAGGGDGGD